ncbi:MAG: xanthine dehydrogenase family protein molybdopterin-binding subunit, partial [Nitrososphaerales archaeon]
GNYVDDIAIPGTLHAAFVRSPYAHAKVKNVDVSGASEVPGVRLVLTGADLAKSIPPVFPRRGSKEFTRHALSADKVRCVGEPVVAVIADSKYLAEDGAELVKVDYEPLPPLIDPAKSLADKDNLLYDEWEDNLFAKQSMKGGDVEKAFNDAYKVLEIEVGIGRASGAAMEGRGVLAEWDSKNEKLTAWVTSQAPNSTKQRISPALKLDEENVRIVSPDVGGGFGTKSGMSLELIVCGHASMQLGHPVKWMETRQESITCSQHGRDQIHHMEVAVTKEGKILGFKNRSIMDIGTPLYQEMSSVISTVRLLLGCYKINDFQIDMDAIATNKGPTGPVRGNGKPEGLFVIERVVDEVARALQLDPAEVRKVNFIQANEFPYRTGTGHNYDSGDYPGALEKLIGLSEYKKLREEQARLRQEGRYIGLGISSFLDSGGIGPSKFLGVPFYERATVRVEASGRVTILSGVHSHGQTLDTTLSKICAEELGIGIHDVTVIMGDTSIIPMGAGTFGSRSCALGGSAVLLAARKVKEKMILIAANMLEVEADKVELSSGTFSVKGETDKKISFKEVANAAMNQVMKLPAGMEPGLEGVAYFDPPGLVYANGSHLAKVEVDPQSGHVELLDYFAVDDGGKIINPLSAEGQIIGGIMHGVGNALYEEIVYGEDGQLLTTSFMNYLLPSALETPHMVTDHLEIPSPNNPLGVKGIGESGTVGAFSAVVNAVGDAIAPLGAKVPDSPLTPEKVWRAIRKGNSSN